MRQLQERRPVVAALTAAPARRRLLIPVLAAVIIVADQVSKSWALHHINPLAPRHVLGPLNLVLTYNSGAAFSLGQGITPIVEAAVVVLIVWLLAISRRASRAATTPAMIGLGLILGGALSNLGDRLFRHLPGHSASVVDFIQAASWWPVFNVADASVVVGVVVVLAASALRRG